jgi:hypothetical protein
MFRNPDFLTVNGGACYGGYAKAMTSLTALTGLATRISADW